MSSIYKESTVLVDIDGKVTTKPNLLGQYGTIRTFRVIIETKRISGKVDIFQLDYTSELGIVLKEGDFINVSGDIRTLNDKNTGFIIEGYIFANNITVLDKEPETYRNDCIITGGVFYNFIDVRKSYDGTDTDIADYTVCTKRKHGRTSYFRATSWKHDAIFIGNYKNDLNVIDVKCRLQSYEGKQGDKHFICLAVYRFTAVKEDKDVKSEES